MKIGVDLRAIRAGGENGGAAVLARELLAAFRARVPEHAWVLLTAGWNHALLADWEGPDTTRWCVERTATGRPPGVLGRGARWLRRRARRWMRPRPLQQAGIELLFCPFSAVTLAEPGLPTVVVAHDLQEREFPENFSSTERRARAMHWEGIARRAEYVVCVSAFTRDALLRHLPIAPERVAVVHSAVHGRWRGLADAELDAHQRAAGLDATRYFVYPANFWPHKNHAVLWDALRRLRERPGLRDVRLVCPGAVGADREAARRAAQATGVADAVDFPGHVSVDALETLLRRSQGLVFASRYEGFGLPVLESMALGVPVACSRAASLPEIAAEAALYFAPDDPVAIAAAMERLLADEALRARLQRAGQARAAGFSPERMVDGYAAAFAQACRGAASPRTAPA